MLSIAVRLTQGPSLAKSEKRFEQQGLASIRLCFLPGNSLWNSLTFFKPEGLQHGLGSVTQSNLIISCYAITQNSVFVTPMQWVDFRSHPRLPLQVLPSLSFLFPIVTFIVFLSSQTFYLDLPRNTANIFPRSIVHMLWSVPW